MNANARRNSSNASTLGGVNSGPNIVVFLFQLQIATKMFHWQTTRFAAHQASGALYDRIAALTDAIIERYMGLYSRPRMPAAARVGVPNVGQKDMVDLLRQGIEYLSTRLPRDPLIQNLRDELTGEMAKALYLLTMQ